MQTISSNRQGRRSTSLVILVSVALAATIALATPSKARADSTWGASVAFYCYDYPNGGELRIGFTGLGMYSWSISVNGAAWSEWQPWSSQARSIPTGNANVRFSVQYRYWNGGWRYSNVEWGAVYQVVSGYNQWRGWGANCVL